MNNGLKPMVAVSALSPEMTMMMTTIEPVRTGSVIVDVWVSVLWAVIPRMALIGFVIWAIIRKLSRVAVHYELETSIRRGWAVVCGLLLGISALMFFGLGTLDDPPEILEANRRLEMTADFLGCGWGAGVLAIGAAVGVVRFHPRPQPQPR